jgi:hypothetical protein
MPSPPVSCNSKQKTRKPETELATCRDGEEAKILSIHKNHVHGPVWKHFSDLHCSNSTSAVCRVEHFGILGVWKDWGILNNLFCTPKYLCVWHQLPVFVRNFWRGQWHTTQP